MNAGQLVPDEIVNRFQFFERLAEKRNLLKSFIMDGFQELLFKKQRSLKMKQNQSQENKILKKVIA